MSKSEKERNIGKEILDGIRQIKNGDVGRVTHYPPIAEVRERVGLSQSEFAKLLGVSVRTLQEWEQGRRVPSGPARTLLRIAHKNPQALLEVAV
jgi:putative transcriptional regulator